MWLTFRPPEQKSTSEFIPETENRSLSNLTSPRILNKELFPHPFGPQTKTFIPERTLRKNTQHVNYTSSKTSTNDEWTNENSRKDLIGLKDSLHSYFTSATFFCIEFWLVSLFKSFMIGESDSLINWKRSFFSRLGLPLIRLENGAFRIRILSSNRNNFITKFWKHFENKAFPKRWFRDNLWFPCPSFPQTQIQNERWFLGYQISRV